MTTSLSPRTLGIDTAPSASGPIPFPRLVRAEWTKATDTRAARWLLALVALSTIGMMLAPILAPTSIDQTYTSYLRVAALALVILLITLVRFRFAAAPRKSSKKRKGAVAELTAEWAMLLAHVLDIARDALAERSASIELLE